MNMVAEILLREPAPVAIWAILTLLTLPALLVLGSPAGVRNPWRALREPVEYLREQRRQRRADAAEADLYAEELRVAADRAELAADRWRERWEQTGERTDAAARAWLAAEERLTRSRAAAAFGTPASTPDPAEYAQRERFLHRAVWGAAKRDELPAGAVADAQAGRAGWDPRLHPMDQEIVVLRAAAGHLRGRYRAAEMAERAAWHDAELARRTRDSLRAEAAAAAAHAAPLRHLLPARSRRAAHARRHRAVAQAA